MLKAIHSIEKAHESFFQALLKQEKIILRPQTSKFENAGRLEKVHRYLLNRSANSHIMANMEAIHENNT